MTPVRRPFHWLWLVPALWLLGCVSTPEPHTLAPATLAAELREGQRSAAGVTRHFLARIARLDSEYRAVIAVAPDAVEQARDLDRRLRARGPVGPLHGVPVLVKDNIETRSLPTTAGSLALADNRTGRDAPLVERLRQAGAVILGKTNLSEWANFRSERSSSGWSAVGGQTRNAVDPGRSPCGSSSGSAVAVALGFAPLSVGTETNGSIVCPAAVNGVVGFKPTVGVVHPGGIVPIAASQDTAGPFARDVAGAALLLEAMAEPSKAPHAAAPAVEPAALRLGVVRTATGYHEGVDALFALALERLREAGVTLVDVALERPEGFGRDTYYILLHEFRAGIDAYLATLAAPRDAWTLESLIAFNEANAARELGWFGQEIFEAARDGIEDADWDHGEALVRVRRATREQGIDRALAEHRLDALVAPSGGPAWMIDLVNGDHFAGGFSTFPAVAGYPHLTLPMGRLHGLPIGLSVTASAGTDARVLAIGRALEALELHRAAVPAAP